MHVNIGCYNVQIAGVPFSNILCISPGCYVHFKGIVPIADISVVLNDNTWNHPSLIANILLLQTKAEYYPLLIFERLFGYKTQPPSLPPPVSDCVSERICLIVCTALAVGELLFYVVRSRAG